MINDKNKVLEEKVEEIININVKGEKNKNNYRKIFAVYIMLKNDESKSMVDTITKDWKKRDNLMHLLKQIKVDTAVGGVHDDYIYA